MKQLSCDQEVIVDSILVMHLWPLYLNLSTHLHIGVWMCVCESGLMWGTLHAWHDQKNATIYYYLWESWFPDENLLKYEGIKNLVMTGSDWKKQRNTEMWENWPWTQKCKPTHKNKNKNKNDTHSSHTQKKKHFHLHNPETGSSSTRKMLLLRRNNVNLFIRHFQSQFHRLVSVWKLLTLNKVIKNVKFS